MTTTESRSPEVNGSAGSDTADDGAGVVVIHDQLDVAAPATDVPTTARLPERGRTLRAIAACDEDILRICPEERFKFSGLGAVVIGTSVLAAASMTLGLSIVFDMPFWQVLPGGILWGAFILALDRWLVSSGSGWRHYAPRIVLSVFFGLIVAEPIVVRVFEDAIFEEIASDRRDRIEEQRGRLNDCNPEITDVLDLPSVPEDCGRDQLSELTLPAGQDLAAVGDDLLNSQTTLTAQLDSLSAQLATERQKLADETAGVVGGGLSGEAGDGPAASARRETITGLEEDVARVSGDLDEVNAEISLIRGEGTTTTATAQEQADEYNAARGPAIERELDGLRDELSAKPGLTRRMDVLGTLMTTSVTILLGRLALTLFFVAIDTAPALIKLSSSGGAYDAIMSERLDSAVESDQLARGMASRARRANAAATARQIALTAQIDEARNDQILDEEVDRLARSALARRQRRMAEQREYRDDADDYDDFDDL